MATATIPESHRDLLDSPVVTLAAVGPDGAPQVTALWFLLDDDSTVAVSLNSSRAPISEKSRTRQSMLDAPLLKWIRPLRKVRLRGSWRFSLIMIGLRPA